MYTPIHCREFAYKLSCIVWFVNHVHGQDDRKVVQGRENRMALTLLYPPLSSPLLFFSLQWLRSDSRFLSGQLMWLHRSNPPKLHPALICIVIGCALLGCDLGEVLSHFILQTANHFKVLQLSLFSSFSAVYNMVDSEIYLYKLEFTKK